MLFTGPRPTRVRRGSEAATRRRRLALVGTAGAGALLLLGAPAANAVTVPYAVDFDVPAVAVGGVNQAYLDCPTDVGTSVTVTVTDPLLATHDYATMSAGAADSSPGRVFVDVGPTGLFDATMPGVWSASIKCPGYDAYVTSFQALAPTLPMTVAIDDDYDCTTTETTYHVGARGNTCVTITNNTGQDIRRMGLLCSSGQGFEYPAAGEFPAGATQTYAISGPGVLPFGGTTMTGISVWAELGTNGSGVFAVTSARTVDVPPLPAPLALTTTTGLSAATACSDTGGLASRTVDAGTAVYVCYRVTNTSALAYNKHSLADDALGSLFTFLTQKLEPGASSSYVSPTPIVATASQSHTGTWSAIEASGYDSLPEDYVATATATATITVTDPPVVPAVPVVPAPVETTTTTAPADPAVDAEVTFIPVAQPVEVTPSFTG